MKRFAALLGPLILAICLLGLVGCKQAQPPETTTPAPAVAGQPTEAAAEPAAPAETASADKSVAVVIAPEKFRDEEFLDTRDALKAAGYNVIVVSLQKGTCTGVGGATAEAVATPDEIVPETFAGVAFIGGPGMIAYLKHPEFVLLARKFQEADKVLGAICVAPSILANAGVLKGVEATVWSDNKSDLEAGGAKYSEGPVVTSGRIVTGNGPQASKKFGAALVAALQRG